MLEEAQAEFNDYASEIIEVIGQPTYSHFLAMYLAALAPNTSSRQLLGCINLSRLEQLLTSIPDVNPQVA